MILVQNIFLYGAEVTDDETTRQNKDGTIGQHAMMSTSYERKNSLKGKKIWRQMEINCSITKKRRAPTLTWRKYAQIAQGSRSLVDGVWNDGWVWRAKTAHL